jgi:predicted TIM-barrel fold metal-dependent hydrolase
LYLDPVEENFQINNELVFPLVARAGEHGLPVFIQAGYSRVSHPCQVGDLAAQFPHVAFVAANGGQLNISGMLLGEARQMLVDNPNVLIETSGTYREDFLEEVMTEVGQDRVVFASGAPRYDQEFEMERVNLAHLDDAAKSRMWSDNIRRVLAI